MELLPHIVNVLEAVDRLRAAAGEQRRISRTVRVGTVSAATVPLLVPVLRVFRAAHPFPRVEVVGPYCRTSASAATRWSAPASPPADR
ncbi:hypothetical protein BIV23_36590 [Streptomyces monashensis]|uniref:Uncharacterized protein n=1 Tax=Streptomyces monashensis TaxID=1678012 RepID=A0A1S2PKS2_9ACTN|nr:hypothetical protein BIV23_36590 [Streptomyces monashensis]